jgi:autotransporter-associated beta strand protein
MDFCVDKLRADHFRRFGMCLLLPGLLFAQNANASCGFIIGSTVTCSTPTTLLPFSSLQAGLTANVTSTGELSALLGTVGTALTLGGNNSILLNAGTINPTLLGLSVLNSGVSMGNANASTQTVNNLAGGVINGTTGVSVDLLNLSGTALKIQNGAGGVTTINNAGTIGSNVLVGVSVLQADTPQIAAYGGAQVNMVNTGTVNGRVGFQASAAGNTFINAGTINGSVNMGAGSTNTFTAVTGGSVGNGGSTNINVLNIVGLSLGFAAPGVIDGGAGGSNTLVLQNAVSGSGSGLSGSGSIDAAQYINFGKLQVNSGTWDLTGAVVSGSSQLNGGLLTFNNAGAFGSGVLTGNGGAIQATTGGLTLANTVTLGTGGLTTQGAVDFGLSGVINGTGALTINGSNTLTLSGSNNYSGGTTLAAGGLALGSDLALGTGALNVTGASTLTSSAARTLANAISLGNTLSLNGNNNLTLNGAISGSSGLLKNGSGTLSLNGAGTYQGGLTLNAGTLNLGNATGLGTGTLKVGGASTLTTSSALTAANSILLNNNLTVNSAYDFGLTGAISGTGQLIKNGSNNLTLSGLNGYTGGTVLNAGTVTLGGAGLIGIGTVTVAGNANLDTLTNHVLTNAFTLNAALGLTGSSDLTLNGVVAGSGSLVKNGNSLLTLNTANTYSGGTTLNAGSLMLGTATVLGSGTLNVAGPGTLDTSLGLTVGNAITLGNTLTLTGSNDLGLSGAISGGGHLVKNGANTLALTAANAFTGGTSLNGGTLSVGNNAALGTGSLSLGGAATLTGTGNFSLTNTVQLGANALTVDNANQALSLGGIISGTGSLNTVGNGSLTLAANNSYSGGTTLNAGTLKLGSDAALGTGALTVAGAATLDTTANRVIANALALNANLGLTGTNNLTLNGALSGSGSLVKSGAALLTLTGNNSSYSGTTALNAGTLVVGNANALGSGQLTVGGAASLDSASGLSLANAVQLNANLNVLGGHDLGLSGALTGTGALVKNGASTLSLSGNNSYTGGTTLAAGRLSVGSNTALGIGGLSVTGAANLNSTAATSILANAINLGSALTVDGGNTLLLNGAITGSGRIVKNDSGSLGLNAASTFSGGTTLNAGSLLLGNATALGTGALTVAGAATLDSNQAVNLANSVALGATLTLAGNQDLGLNGALSGTGSLIKNGASNLTLSGNNSFSGGITLNAGTLTAGQANALGSGALSVTGAATLTGTGDYSLSNAVNVGAALAVDTAGHALTLGGVLSGSGGLNKVGNGSLTLSGTNTLSGTTSLNAGTLILGNANALGTGSLQVTGNATLNTTGALNTTNDIALNADLTLAGNNDLGLAGVLSGTGALIKNGSGVLSLTGNNSSNAYTGTLTVNTGAVQGSATSLVQSIVNNALVNINQLANGTYSGAISGTGSVTKSGAGVLELSGTNSFGGGLNVQAGTVALTGGTALSDTGSVALASGTTLQLNTSETVGALTGNGTVNLGTGAALSLGGNNLDATFAGVLSGAGGLGKVGSGILTLSGNSAFGGGTSVSNGTLNVTGTLGSDVSVLNGGTLGGTGTIGGAVSLGAGSALTGVAGQTLTTGNLALDAGAHFNVSLGGPGSSALVQVNGDLVLDGTLNVTGLGGFGQGVYRLMDYTGALTNNGLALGSLPASVLGDLSSIQTNILGQINLAVENATSPIQFWNPNATSTITGGAGSWGLGNTWVNLGGVAQVPWNNGFAVFAGTGAAVSVDAAQNATGLQFMSNGYVLGGAGSIAAADANGLSIRVDPTVTATLNTTITGSGNLNKRDTGTLILGGTNTYTGGTTLSEGVLQVSSDANLGDASGGLTFNGGTLRVTGTSFGSNTRGITWQAGGGGFDIADAGNTFSVAQSLGGTGGLNKLGAGNLLLAGNNTYSGGTTLNAGGIVVGSDTALGTGTLGVLANTTLGTSGSHALGNALALGIGNTLGVFADTGDTLTLNGLVGGLGALDKTGNGTLLLNHANVYAGGTTLSQGTLAVGDNLALGLGALTIAAAGNLDAANGPRTLGNLITLNDDLTVLGSNDLTLTNVISGGAGNSLTKQGSANLTLNALNTFSGGTSLQGGTLTLGHNLALGSGALTVDGAGNLDANSARTLGNALVLNNDLTLLGTADFTLNGVVSGSGGLTKQGTTTLTLNNANTYSGGTTLDGGALVLGTNGTLGSGALTILGATSLDSSTNKTLSNALNLGATLTLPGSANLTLSGAISGLGGLIKQGSNTLTLASAGSYSGDTLVQGGSLLLGDDAALGSSAVKVVGNASLGSSAGDRSVQNAIDIALGKTLSALTGISDTLTLAGPGLITGDGSLLKTGTGTLVLGGANTFTGGLRVADGGNLVVNDDAALGSGLLTLSSATQLSSTNGPRTLGNAVRLNANLTLPGTSDFTLNGSLSGSGALVKNGASNLTLNGSNAYTGGTVLNAGGLTVGNNNALGSAGLNVTGNAALIDAGTDWLNNAVSLGNGNTLTVTTPDALALNGVISGNGSLLSNGAGTLTLSGTNTYSGGTTLNTGGLLLANNAALGSGALTVTGAATLDGTAVRNLSNAIVLNGGDLTLPGSFDLTLGGTISGSNGLIKQGTDTLTLNGSNTYAGGTTVSGGGLLLGNSGALGSGALTLTGDTSLNGSAALTLANAINVGASALTLPGSNALTLNGQLSGSGSLIKLGANTLTLTQDNTPFTGTANLQGGTVLLGNDNALGSAAVSVTGTTSLGNSGTGLRTLGNAVDVAIGKTLNLITASGSDLTLNGAISGAGNLNKTGTGTLAITAANSGFTGQTRINGGTLSLGDSQALGSSALLVLASSNLTGTTPLTLGNNIYLGGNLTVTGTQDLTLNGTIGGGGVLLMNNSGTLTLNGDNNNFNGIQLNAGNLAISTDTALGSGTLSVNADATLTSTGTRSLNNAMVLASGSDLTLASADNLTLGGVLSGSGSLTKTGVGILTLNRANTYTGGTALQEGLLVLGDDLALGSGLLTVSGNGSIDASAVRYLANDIQFTNDFSLTVAGSNNLTLAGDLSGNGKLIKQGNGSLTLGGTNTYSDGTQVVAGTLYGTTLSLPGDIEVDSGARLEFSQNFDGSYGANGEVLSGSGTLAKSGTGVLTLVDGNTFTGLVDILGGTLLTSGDTVISDASQVNVDGAATLAIGGTETLANLTGTGAVNLVDAGLSNLSLGAASGISTFAGTINGVGTLNKVGANTLILTGTSGLTGPVNIQAGTLQVDGSLDHGPVSVLSGATLTGVGVVEGPVTVADGATLAADQTRGTLSVGDLTLNNASNVNMTLGAATAGSLVDVTGNLTLDGQLTITDAGGMGLGVYNLFTYTGALTDNGLNFNSVPPLLSSSFYGLQTGFANQVNLVVQSSPNQVLFWNGSNNNPNGVISGGSGTWGTDTNWTDITGNTGYTWADTFAVFGGATGTPATPNLVSVDGNQGFIGMQFLTDGYVLNAAPGGGSLTASNGATGTTDVRVNTGATAVINADIDGTGKLNKLDGGTLILGGDNSYTGGTRLAGGVVVVDADNRLGDASGGLEFNGGTLQVVGTGYTGTTRAIAFNGAGATLDIVDANNTFALAQVITGTGGLTKLGNGTLELDAANTYAGNTTLGAGTLSLGNVDALSSGTLIVSGGLLASSQDLSLAATGGVGVDNNILLNGPLTVDGSNDLALTGVISGASKLIKTGSNSTLELTGTNTYSGGTDLNAGDLVVGSDTALGTGELRTAAGTQLDSSQAVVLGNQVQLTGPLTVVGSNDLTFGDTVTGSGSLIKNGAASLTLSDGNSYSGGTTLNAGNLLVGANGALGSGGLIVNGGALDSTAPATLNNAITLNTDLDVLGSNNLTLGGVISGNGGVVKAGPAVLTLSGNNTYSGDTDLNAGTLVVGNNNALGTGDLNAANGTTLDSSSAVTLANDVNLAGNVTIAGSNDLTLNGQVSGSGSLSKFGLAELVLNSPNTYSGGTTLDGGTLVVGNNNALGSGDLTVTGNAALDTNQTGLVLTNGIDLQAALTSTGSNPLTLSGDITGGGSLIKNGSGLLTLSGDNTYSGGTTVNAGSLAGDSNSLQGNISTAASTSVIFNQGSTGTYSGILSGSGALVKSGIGNLILSGVNTYTGGTAITAGSLTGNSTSLQGNIQIGTGTSLIFDQGVNGTYSGSLSGNGDLIKQGNGNLNLTGTSTIGGSTIINNGALVVEGSLTSDDIIIGAGGSLGGGGSLNGDVTIANGAHLVAGTYLTPLSFADDLNLTAGTTLDFLLGIPNSPTSLINVGGDLTLDGTLNIANAGGLGVGVYRLFSYGGSLTNNGLDFGSVPLGYGAGDFTLQTSLAGQVNLLLEGVAGEIQFWDGAGTPNDGVISGGTGTWNSASQNWTNANGTSADAWNERFAAFAGTGATVWVDGAQNFTGMQFLSNGYVLSDNNSGSQLNALTDANGSAPRVIVDNGVSAEIAVTLDGNAGLVKAGAGTLILSADNNYTGDTQITGGVLQVDNDDSLGDSSSNIVLNGGVLGIAGTSFTTTTRGIALGTSGGGFDIQNAANTFTAGQSLSGTGSLVKQGAGTLLLSGTNTYSGGTLLQGGTLVGDSNSLQGNIASSTATTLQFDQTGAGTFAGNYSGAGKLIKSGAGSLTLGGNNSYTGGTTVDAGRLIGNSDSLQGNVLVNSGGELEFAQSSNGVFDGLLSGTGDLIKSGLGTLLITDNQSFTGNVQINGGALIVGDASAQTHRLDSNIAVGSNGLLGGTGWINNLSNNGTVTPGYDGNGTLNVMGSYTSSVSSRLLVRLISGQSSSLSVGNTAALAGTLQVQNVAYNGSNSSITLVSAANGISGQFDNTVLPNFAFLNASVNYTSNTVTLDLERNGTGLGTVAITPNQSAVAGALDRAGGGELYNAILGLSREEAADAYDQLSGEAYASSIAAMQTSTLMAQQAVLARMRQTCQASSTYSCSVQNPLPLMPLALEGSDDAQSSAWAYALGGWGTQDGDRNSASMDHNTSGMMFGYDRALSDAWRGGFTTGYSHTSADVDARNSDMSIDAYHLGAYARYQEKRFSLRTGAMYSWQDVDSTRDVAFTGFSDRLKADYDAHTWQVFGEAGYLLDFEAVNVEPYLNLTHTQYKTDTIKEKGGAASLESKIDESTTTSTLGARAATTINLRKETALVLRGGLGWQHTYGDEIPEADMTFGGSGTSFTTQGTPVAKDAAIVEAGVEMNVGLNSKVQVSYSGQLASDARNHEMKVEYSYQF